eukprot:gene19450-23125_t
MIRIKRIYEAVSQDDGFRVLVDRLWPRGLKKEQAQIQLWLKEIAPSAALRKWFDHEAEKWATFKNSYTRELSTNKAVKQLVDAYKKHPEMTLLYAAKEQQYNHALVLQDFLIQKMALS